MTTMLFSEIAFVAFWPLTILLLAIYFNPTGKFRTAFWTILTLSVLLSCFVLFQLAGSQSMVGSNFVLVSLLIGGTLFGTFMTLAFVRGVLGFGAPLLNPANISRTKLALSSSLLIPCAIAAVYYSGSRL